MNDLESGKMRALRLTAEKKDNGTSDGSSWIRPKVSLVRVPIPKPEGDQLLIKTIYCGLCGSDFHLASCSVNGVLDYPGLVRPPVTLGHEVSGMVVGYGSEIAPAVREKFPVGAPVTCEEMYWCGVCGPCREGRPDHCEELEELGFTRDGGHAEFFTISSKYCWSLVPLLRKFSQEEALKMGALVEPYSVSYRALFDSTLSRGFLPSDRVLILGCGPIGLSCLDLAKVAGAAWVDAVELVAGRRERAREFGVRIVFSDASEIPIEEKYDWVVDAAGADIALTRILALNLGVGGTLSIIARSGRPLSIDSELLITKNISVVGSQGHTGRAPFGRVLRLMAEGKLQVLKLIYRSITLEEAKDVLTEQKKSSGKVLVHPRNLNEKYLVE